MNTWRRAVRLGAVLLSFLSTGWATDSALPPVLTVDQLVQQVLALHAELRFYEAEVASVQGQRRQAGLWKNPEFSGDYGSRRVTDKAGTLSDKGETRGMSITQTFEFPGKGSLRKAIAEKNGELAELGLRQFRLTLIGQVKNLALQYQAASANAAAAEEIDERSHALLKLLKERTVAGVAPLLELRAIEGSLWELLKFTKNFQQERDAARIELNSLLGFPTSRPLSLRVDLVVPVEKKRDLSQLVLLGLSNNLSLKIRQAELEKAGTEVSAAKMEIAPDFSVGPFFSQDKAGDTEENFGATVSLTLPLWNWNQGNIATAQVRQRQAETLLLDARRKVERAIARCFRAYELNQRQIEQMPRQTLDDLRAASDLADRQYRTGGINLPLFLEVQRQFLNAQQTRNEAITEAWKNWLDLELLVGGAWAEAQK